MYNELKKRILSKEAIIGIIGLGYVGLPIAMSIVRQDYNVIGIDTNKKRVDQLMQGESYIIDTPDTELEEAIKTRFTAYDYYEPINRCDVVLICVPTPLTESKVPDLSYIIKSVDAIVEHMKRGVLIVLESTTYPGTTQELIVDRIERERDYKVGEDFFVCFSPERVDPGNIQFQVTNTPKVIGGTTEKCLEMGRLLYESFLEQVVTVTSTKVAEMSKLLENTFRCINIGFINEMTMMCEKMDVNIWEVIKAASSKPFGYMTFYPGPGIGGHCIPLDPLYLSWEGKKYNYFNKFIELATDINANMPNYVVKQIQDILNEQGIWMKKANILLLGMAYKKDIDDLRESPALEVYKLLKERQVEVSFYDSYIDSFYDEDNQKVYRINWDEDTISQKDLVVILTDHSNVDYEWVEQNATLIYDTKNVMGNMKSKKVILLGEHYKGEV